MHVQNIHRKTSTLLITEHHRSDRLQRADMLHTSPPCSLPGPPRFQLLPVEILLFTSHFCEI